MEDAGAPIISASHAKPALGFFATIARTIRDAVRALFFRRVEPSPAPPHSGAVIAIALLAILATAAIGWISNRRISLPSTWGLTSSAASFAILAGGLMLLSGCRRAFDVAAAFCLLLTITMLSQPIGLLLTELPPRVTRWANGSETIAHLFTGAGFVLAAWWIASIATLGTRLMPSRRTLGALGLVAAMILPAFLLPSAPLVKSNLDATPEISIVEYAFDLIRPPRPPSESHPPVDIEAAYARQPRLVAAALENVQPSRADRSEIYFVSAGLYAGQDVFLRESSSAREIFDARMGTAGRSLLLVNNRQTVDTLPLANATNLEQALAGLAKLMNPEKDVLALFVTSHGTERALDVSFRGFSFNELTPERLAGILARSPIRHRVVIISACHSGTFIPALAGPGTMVITAARTDRTSFGCSNEREWTYFGDAFFNRALRETRSLVDAFHIARSHIDAWEKRDALTPSEPQISIGDGIAAKLREMTAKLE